MTRLEQEYRDCKNAMIGYDHHRWQAARMRRKARTVVMRRALRALPGLFQIPAKALDAAAGFFQVLGFRRV